MTGAHRHPDENPVRSTLQSAWWLLLLAGVIVAGPAVILAIVGIPIYLIATGSKYQLIAVMALQGFLAVALASRLALKVLRNRTPSPVILADWIGDAAFMIMWIGILLSTIGQNQGWMHGAFEYAIDSIFGLFAVGMLVYFWWGKPRLVLALTARAVDSRWPWSAGE